MRFDKIDLLKGVAVIFMVIFHIFYFPNQYGFKEFNYETKTLKTIARVAQIIFITGVGVNMYISYNSDQEKIKKDKKRKSEFLKKQLYRILKLVVIAIFISVFSYYIFGDMFVKFGILHFMAFSSLLLMPFVDSPKILGVIILITLFVRYLIQKDKKIFYNIPKKLAFVTGLYSSYGAVDHFPIVPWIVFICIGIILGRVITNKKNQVLLEDKKEDKNLITKGVKWCGKNSLEIYVVHWILLFIFFAYIYPKIRITNN